MPPFSSHHQHHTSLNPNRRGPLTADERRIFISNRPAYQQQHIARKQIVMRTSDDLALATTRLDAAKTVLSHAKDERISIDKQCRLAFAKVVMAFGPQQYRLEGALHDERYWRRRLDIARRGERLARRAVYEARSRLDEAEDDYVVAYRASHWDEVRLRGVGSGPGGCECTSWALCSCVDGGYEGADEYNV